MRYRNCLSVVALLLGSLATPYAAADDAVAWLLTPPVDGPPTRQDATARDELLRRIETLQTDDFRRAIKIEVPDRATGLPQDYDILIYGTYGRDAQRLEIQVRGTLATAELSANRRLARRRGALPAAQVDQLTRELLYGAMTRFTLRKGDGGRDITRFSSRLFATHAIFFRIDLISRDTQQPLRLMTAARQIMQQNIEPAHDAVQGYAHGRYCRELLNLAFTHLQEIPSEVASAGEIIGRLEALAARVDRLGVEAPRIRADETDRSNVVGRGELDRIGLERAVVEARILGRLAVDGRAKDAAPILDRLGQRRLANHVRLITADDAGAAVQQGLLSSDWSTYQLALGIAGARLQPADVTMLLDAAPLLPDTFRQAEVLRKLESAELTAAHLVTIRGIYRDAAQPRLRVAAARLLVWKTDDDQAYHELTRIALAPVKLDGSDVYSPVFAAADAILASASATGKRRGAAAELIRTLLDRIPADAHATYSHQSTLARYLGALGEPGDLPRLEALVGRKDLSLNVDAIHAIADLDGRRAVERVREQITCYLDDPASKTSYRWSVYPYFDVIFWQRDQASTDLLVKSLEKHRQSPEIAEQKQPAIEALLEYLRSERVEDRVAAARCFLQHNPLDRLEWRVDVGKQLLAAGADPELCQPLLEPPSRGESRAQP